MTQENKRLLELKNIKGIHARVAAKIVKTAEPFEAEATLSYRNITVPLLSIMGLMTLSARKGAKVEVCAEGSQSKELFQALQELFERKFDED